MGNIKLEIIDVITDGNLRYFFLRKDNDNFIKLRYELDDKNFQHLNMIGEYIEFSESEVNSSWDFLPREKYLSHMREKAIDYQRFKKDEERYNLIEKNTKYSIELKKKFNSNKFGFGFSIIRDISLNFVKRIPEKEKDNIYLQLKRGISILNTNEQLHYYNVAFGNLHKKKLDIAYKSISKYLNSKKIEIIDYGCGQALATVMLIDFCKSQKIELDITKVILIEPSKTALTRGALNVSLSCRSFHQNTKIYSINNKLQDISEEDLQTEEENLKIHLFSNILDIEDFSVTDLSKKIKNTQEKSNIYVCVSPNFFRDGSHPRNERINRFQKEFTYFPVVHKISQNGFIKIFKTGFSDKNISYDYSDGDDLPF